MMDEYVCDCGHTESKHSDFTRGYSTDREGRTSCYPCTLNLEITEIKETGRAIAYLSGDSKRVTNWPGHTISNEVYILSESRDNFGGNRTYLRFRLDDEVYSGFALGAGMYLRARKTKFTDLYAT